MDALFFEGEDAGADLSLSVKCYREHRTGIMEERTYIVNRGFLCLRLELEDSLARGWWTLAK